MRYLSKKYLIDPCPSKQAKIYQSLRRDIPRKCVKYRSNSLKPKPKSSFDAILDFKKILIIYNYFNKVFKIRQSSAIKKQQDAVIRQKIFGKLRHQLAIYK